MLGRLFRRKTHRLDKAKKIDKPLLCKHHHPQVHDRVATENIQKYLAAITLQKNFRGYAARKKSKFMLLTVAEHSQVMFEKLYKKNYPILKEIFGEIDLVATPFLLDVLLKIAGYKEDVTHGFLETSQKGSQTLFHTGDEAMCHRVVNYLKHNAPSVHPNIEQTSPLSISVDTEALSAVLFANLASLFARNPELVNYYKKEFFDVIPQSGARNTW